MPPVNPIAAVNISNTNSTGFNYQPASLVSICNPLGCELPVSMKTKIVNGEYVDFALLLEKCEFRDNNDKKRKALSVNNLGQVVWDEVKPKRFISSIHSWTSAFLCYTSVYAGAHPHRAQ